MKKRKFNQKLSIRKETISNLNKIKGGIGERETINFGTESDRQCEFNRCAPSFNRC